MRAAVPQTRERPAVGIGTVGGELEWFVGAVGSSANRSNTSSSIPAIMGAQPSPNARTRSSTVRPAPPTMIGGYGVWTGLGQARSRSKFTSWPWYSASSLVQISIIAWTRSVSSRHPGLRVGAVVAHLLAFQPAPTPKITRPSESTSTVATLFRGVDRVPLRHQTHPGRDLSGGGGCRRGGHRDERVEWSSHTGPRRHPLGPIYPDRQMGVLGEPQGLQATVLDHPSESTWRRGVDVGEHRDTDLQRVTPSIRPRPH